MAARIMDDGAVILFHLTPSGKIVGATGFGRAESIGRDVRLAQILIADRAHPDPALLRDATVRAEIDRQNGEGQGNPSPSSDQPFWPGYPAPMTALSYCGSAKPNRG